MRKNSSKKHGVNSILNRSQSAMEYLMTYGWAILIIAIVLVALFSLGIFNSANFAPRAQPGSCEVLRNSVQTSLVGQCNGMLPEYVAQFNNGSKLENITINNAKELAPSIGSNLTITLWVKPLYTSGFGGVAFTTDPSTAQIGWQTQFTPTGTGGTSGWLVSNVSAQGGIWSFMAVKETVGKSASIYLNGDLTAYTTNSAMVSSTQTATTYFIGTYVTCCQYKGSLANIQIYNASLSNSSIQALYKEGIGGAPINVNNLMGWWPLNGNANDYSGYGNDGTAANVTYTSSWTSGYSAP